MRNALILCAALAISCGSGGLPTYAKNRQLAFASLAQPSDNRAVSDWFRQYDRIRKNAQMSPEDKSLSRKLLGKGLNPLASDEDRSAARTLVTKMVSKYAVALNEIHRLRPIPQTRSLQSGYTRFFSEAHDLFTTYLSLQNNLFGSKKGNCKTMIEKKHVLDDLDHQNKDLDEQLRKRYNIPAFS